MRRHQTALTLAALLVAQLLLPTRPAATATEAYEQRVVELVNAGRTGRGLNPLIVHYMLENAAEAHSIDLSQHAVCQHDSTNGTPWHQRIQQFGYTPFYGLAENVGCGYPTPESVVAGWMNSSGHRANILGDYAHVGVGYYANFWTLDFGQPAPGTPPPCAVEHDFDGNGSIGAGDIALVAGHWPASQPYDATYDLNHDQTVNVVDVMVVASEWGTSCP